VQEDGLYRPEIKRHSLEKIRRHNYYAALFSKAMHSRWKHRVYIGLYAGAGRALVQPEGELVETSALGVLQQGTPFTKRRGSTCSSIACRRSFPAPSRTANGSPSWPSHLLREIRP
jgi:hypothetical protein